MAKIWIERAMDNKLDLFALLKSIVRHRRFIITFVILVSIGAVGFALWYPKHWQSNAVISVTTSSASFPGVLKGLISDFSPGLEEIAGNSEAQRQTEILASREFGEKVVRKFNLIKYFKFKPSQWSADSLLVMDMSIIKLQRNIVSFYVNEVTGTITISAITKDKVLSRDLVNFYVDELDKFNRITRLTKGREKREFLERRIQQLEKDVNKQADDLMAFQQKNHIINIDEQVSAAISSFSEIIKQKVQTATELEFMLSYLPQDSPKIEEYKSRIKSINTQINKMQNDSFAKYIPNFDNVNALTLQYMKKTMQLDITKQIYETILPQYELAKLEEINDLTSIQYIQKASLAGVRQKPKRARICIAAFILACVFSVFSSFLYDLLATQKERFKEIINTR